MALRIEGVTPEEYASQWGCDPAYDRPPAEPGDGYHLYNFSSEIQKRTPEYLHDLLGAIERRIAGHTNRGDRRGLRALHRHVSTLLLDMIETRHPPALASSQQGCELKGTP